MGFGLAKITPAIACAASLVLGACGSSVVGTTPVAEDAGNPADGAPSDAGGSTSEDAELDVGSEPAVVRVEIGIPAGDDGLEFAPLSPGGELRLESFGQGGMHVLLAVRCIGFGNRAFVGLAITNLTTGVQVTSPPPVRPQLLLCRDQDVCDLVPLLAVVSGIADPGVDRNGLHVEVEADVRNEAGLSASASVEAVLSTADL